MNDENSSIELSAFLPSPYIGRKIILLAVGLLLPAVLIPIVHIVGASVVVEELAKGAVVIALIAPLPKGNYRGLWTVLFAFLFGISESVFYFSNYFDLAGVHLFLLRLVTTVPMHCVTALVILLGARKGIVGTLLALIVAIGIHLVFNTLIG